MKVQLVYWIKTSEEIKKKYMECEMSELEKILSSIEGLEDYEFEFLQKEKKFNE